MGERFGQHPGLMQGDIGDRYTRKRLSDEVYVAHHIKVGDQIRVQCFLATGVAAAVTTVTLFVGGRVRGLDGELTQFGNTFAFTADGAQTVSYVMAPEGYVVDLIAATDTLGLGATDVGVKIDIMQGIGSNAVAVGLLASGYVSYAHALGLGGAGNIGGGSGGGMIIGGPVTGGTAKSVLFLNAGPVLAQDNAHLAWDDANNRLGIGTNAPTHSLHLVTTNAGLDPAFFAVSESGNGVYPTAVTAKITVPGVALQNPGDAIALYANAVAADNTVTLDSLTALSALVQTHGATNVAIGVLIALLKTGGTTTVATGLRIADVNIGTENYAIRTSAGQVWLGDVLRLTPVAIAALPASAATGMVQAVTDSLVPVIGSTVGAGGSAPALVWYNGTNWTVIGK